LSLLAITNTGSAHADPVGGWKLYLPEIVLSKELKRQRYLLIASCQLAIDHTRARALAALRIKNIHLASGLYLGLADKHASMPAKQSRLCCVVLEVATRRLPAQSQRYAPGDPATTS